MMAFLDPSAELDVVLPNLASAPAKWANPDYFTMPYGISRGHSGLCPQRLMARVLG
jgi:hypothetical protein